MKTRAAWLTALAVAAVATSYAAARLWRERDGASDIERLQDVSHLARALDLRPDQIEAVASLQKRLCGNLAASCARHCACRGDLAALLVAEDFDSARVRDIRESMCRAYADSEMATVEHIRDIRDLLDARQRARFDRMITEALTRGCGVCSGRGCECEARSGAARRVGDEPRHEGGG